MRHLIAALAGLTALACAAHAPPVTKPAPANPAAPPPAPPAPPPNASQAVRLGPSALRYVMHQVIHVDQQLPDRQQVLDYGLSAYFHVTIAGPADSSGYATTVTIDSIAPDSGTTVPMGINLDNARGLAFTGRLAPTGEFRNPTPSDTAAAQSVSPVVGSFRNFFPRLPARGVTAGAAWTDTLTTDDRSAGNVTVTSINHSRASAWEDHAGTRSVRVDVTSEFTIQGSGEQNQYQYQVSGNGLHTGSDYISVDGRYLGGEARDSTTMTITLPAQSTTIPRTQVSRTTVAVLP